MTQRKSEGPSDWVRLELELLDLSSNARGSEDTDSGERDTEAEGLTLLVADDDADIRLYIRRCIRSYGGAIHRVIEARHGEEALQVLAHVGVDVLVCDAVMPKLDGFALCRSVRADPALRTIPVLLITGEMTCTEATDFAAQAGADAVLTKPFNARRLGAALEELLERSSNPARVDRPDPDDPDRQHPEPPTRREL